MKPRRVFADLDLEIDGQPAKFTGKGRHMRLEVQDAGTLRKNLPSFSARLSAGGTAYSVTDVPSLLADEGLTLKVVDKRGPLLTLGEEAHGRGYSVPGIGRVNDVTLANKRAAFRLASSSGPSWLLPVVAVALVVLGVILATRRRD